MERHCFREGISSAIVVIGQKGASDPSLKAQVKHLPAYRTRLVISALGGGQRFGEASRSCHC